MNRTDFLKMMEDSFSIDSATTSDIGEIVAMFPYFQTAHLLLLRGLHLNSDIRFTNQLRNSALHIADREILYQFLYSTPSAATITEEQYIVNPDPETEKEVTEASSSEDSFPQEETRKDFPVPQNSQAGEEENKVIPSVADQIVAEDSSQDNKAEEAGMTLPEEEVTIILPEEEVTMILPEEEVTMILPEEEVTMTLPEEEVSMALQEVTMAMEEEKADDVVVINEITVDISDDESLLELDTENGQDEEIHVINANTEEVKLSQSDLIDRFIIANPRIEPNREKKEVAMEDRSVPVCEEGVFVTETLARIYISQGYYSKAIDIFEKLSLKYPEKSSYFATQIEKVKEYLKK